MSNGNYMCALPSFFIVSFFFYNKSPSLLQTTDSIAHVFLAEGVGGASIASDRGSAPAFSQKHVGNGVGGLKK